MNRMIVRWSILLTVGFVSSRSLATEPPEARPKVWAVVVGIDRYEDSLIPPCSGSVRDARAIAEWFSVTAGWGERQVLRMDDLGRPGHGLPAESLTNLKPTRANLDWALVEWLGQRVGKNDIVVIYFAGQAVARPPNLAGSPGRTFLLPIDARGAALDQTGWSIDETIDRARTRLGRQARMIVWLDTSPAGRGPRGMTREAGGPSGQDWLRTLTRWPGTTAWLAADGRPASEGAGGTLGPFAGSLIRSLGSRDQAHNLLGTLGRLNDDPESARRGFQSMGGIGPSVSLWTGGARVVEEAVPELIIQSGHGDRVTSVLVTADNSTAITASQDSTVRVWSLADRSLLRILTDPLVGVEALTLDRDGSVLIAGDGVGRIFGWDLSRDRPKPFYGPPEHTEGIRQVAFLPEGKRFVSLDRSRRSVLWDASDGAIQKVGVFSDQPIARLTSVAHPDPTGAALVSVTDSGLLVSYNSTGQPSGRFSWTGGRITTFELSRDERNLVLGDSCGKLALVELPGWKVAFSADLDGKIHLARFAPGGRLLVADDSSLKLIEPRPDGSTLALMSPDGAVVGGEVDRAAFSNDGQWLAVCTPETGRVLAWRLTEGGRAEPAGLPQGDSQGLSLAFSPDSRVLLAGNADGGIQSWSMPEKPGPNDVKARPTILPARGKVASLVPSPSGRYLLEITRDDLAVVWDLKEGRGCQSLPGRWISGGFLADESRLVLVQRPDRGGDLVVFDRTSQSTLLTRFERPSGPDGRPRTQAFSSLMVSKSGKWVAAASLAGLEPLACVWSVETGKLLHFVRDHDGGLSSVDLSAEETYLLTGSEDGSAKIWPMDDPALELRKPRAILANPDAEAPPVTTASFCPRKPGRVVVGTRGGFVFLWENRAETGKAPAKWERIDLGRLDGSINATTFSSDGRWVVASSAREKSLRFWSIPDTGKPVFVPFLPRPHHTEQVGALAAWPNGSMILSGGDDAAVRFWDLKDHALIGTLVMQARDSQALDWLAFTPDGLFDGSLPGESMVKWRVGEKIVTLQQSQDLHHVFQLAGAFPIGEKIRAPRLKDDSPQIRIATPGLDRISDRREVELTLWTGDADPSELRLYQNGVPIKGAGDFEPGDGPNLRKARVTLRKGDNTFYAMASKAGEIDGQTEPRTIRFEGPDPPGRVHTLAIGVSGYDKRPLKYAHSDARSIADFFQAQQRQTNVQPGERMVLVDTNVTTEKIDNAFRQIREAVKGRPQDTVVLFLAGHTDTDNRNEQFCLLLPDFPFEGAPPPDPIRSNDPLQVASRGNVGGSTFSTRVGARGVLPYSVLYHRLTRLDALQRLIIVDACQAAAIRDDPAVRNIQRLVDKGSRSARNSYLLAARRGEPASEADVLKHGLLTYTLLHGLRATGLEQIPAELGGFPGKPTADRNLDGVVSSAELAEYAEDSLPRLARLFPQLVTRAGNPGLGKGQTSVDGSPDLEERGKLQSTDDAFPLIELPR